MDKRQYPAKKRQIVPMSDTPLMPSAPALEESVLGACLLEKSAMTLVSSILRPTDFYIPAHAAIYAAMEELYVENVPIDLVTVSERLTATKMIDVVGGSYRLVEITHKVASAANVEYHARVVKQYSGKRALIEHGYKLAALAQQPDTDVFNLIDLAVTGSNEISTNIVRGKKERLASVIDRVLDPPPYNYKPLFGIPDFDLMTGGEKNADLLVIGARPNIGKSVLGNMAIREALYQKVPIYFWSGEMTASETILRLISSMTIVDKGELELSGARRLSEAQLFSVQEAVSTILEAEQAGRLIIETGPMSSLDFRSKCIQLAAKGFTRFVADRLELFTDHDAAKETESKSVITQRLRQTVGEAQCTIILMSQLVKAVDSRPGGIPQAGDLLSRTDQDATRIVLIARPDRYGLVEDEEGNSMKDVAILILAKNTYGKVGPTKVAFAGQYSLFHNLKSSPTPAGVSGGDDLPF